MHEAIPSPIAAWETFYVIVGSSGAALTGLQFVVIALIAEARMQPGGGEIAAFGTPTVVHFCAVLLVAAILTAPWPMLAAAATAVGAVGFAGVIYAAIVVRRARRQRGYKPVFEDWLWHAILPLCAYTGAVVAAILLQRSPAPSLFVIGGAVLLLLFIGIHNSWDTVTYIAVEQAQRRRENKDRKPD